MKPLVDSLLKDLEDLIKEMHEAGVSKLDEEELTSLRNALINSKKPSILTQDLLTSYYMVLSTITEALIVIRELRDYVSISIIIVKVKESIKDFLELLKKAQIREKIQLAIPIYLGLLITLVNFISEPSSLTLIPFLMAIIALSTSWINLYLGLSIILIMSIVNIALFGPYIEVLFTNILLALSAFMYIYILRISHSHRYTEKLNLTMENIRTILINRLRSIDKSYVLSTLDMGIGDNEIIHSAMSELIDKASLQRYKVAVMLMNGLLIHRDHAT